MEVIAEEQNRLTKGSKMLGQGIYTLAEVSSLTEIHPSRVRAWFRTRPDGAGRGPVFQADYAPVKGEYAYSFLDLIDVLVAGQFRDRHNVSMTVVHKAHTVLQKELSTKHPFCHADLYTDGKRIFSLAAKEVGEPILVEVVSRLQFFLHVREKLDHIDYSEVTKLACRWNIAEGVIIDPAVSMGKPTICETGLTTHVMANQYYANRENADIVADLYGVCANDVINAVKFEHFFMRRRVA